MASAATAPGAVWEHFQVRAQPQSRAPVAAGLDVNRDGYSDLVVGAPFSGETQGEILVFLGSSMGLRPEPQWRARGTKPQQHLGFSVAMLDVNGDGFADIAATEVNGPVDAPPRATRIQLYFGGPYGLPAQPSQVLASTDPGLTLAHHLASAGDVNGDSCGDLAVSGLAPTLGENPAVVAVYLGSREGLGTQPAWRSAREQPGSSYGSAFGGVGDVNRDGFGDFVVGAATYTGKFSRGGKAYLFLGSAWGLKATPEWSTEYPREVDAARDGDGANFGFGAALGPAGDIDRDGYADVLIGASNAAQGEFGEGLTFLFRGHPKGLLRQPAWSTEGNRPHVHLGFSVQGTGDLDGDGYGDVLVGAPYVSNGSSDEGVVLGYRGSAQGLERWPSWSFEGNRPGGHLGEFVLPAGDLNGDGHADVVFGGVDMDQPLSPRLRVIAVCGGKSGLPGGSGWSPRKPLIDAASDWMESWNTRERMTAGLAVFGLGTLAAFGLGRIAGRKAQALLEQQRLRVMHAERLRLARDLHDEVGPQISALARFSAQLGAAGEAPPPGPEVIRDISRELTLCLERTIWSLESNKNTLEDLVLFLGRYADSFLAGTGIACRRLWPADLPPVRLGGAARKGVVLIFKEALHNVLRHAQATELFFRAECTDRGLVLEIEDNGRGVTEATGNRGGHGLANMNRRAAELGGRLVIGNGPGGGCVVRLELPLGSSRADAATE